MTCFRAFLAKISFAKVWRTCKPGRWTVPAWVAIGLPRLRRAGLARQEPTPLPANAELELYRMLQAPSRCDAYSRYNALMRELVSFEQALDRRRSRELKATTHERQH